MYETEKDFKLTEFTDSDWAGSVEDTKKHKRVRILAWKQGGLMVIKKAGNGSFITSKAE